jgi:segregation and condensation protein B
MNNLDLKHIRQVVEACLFSAVEPISVEQLVGIFDEQINSTLIKNVICDLEEKYTNSGIELLSLANGYRFRTRLELQPYLNKLHNIKPPRYSRTIMETLAIIAYRQPITRGEIEDIRGVAVNSHTVQVLIERGWIDIIGQKQVPGKPDLLATTSKFLDDLSIKSLQELPEITSIDPTSFMNSQDLMEEYEQGKMNF